MQFYYGSQNILRALDEAEFWKHQEAEHAELIPIVTPNLEPEYTQTLAQLALELHKTHAQTVQYIESITRSKGMLSREMQAQMRELIKTCMNQSEDFTRLMDEMLKNSHAVQSSKPSQTVIHHMIRESKYFIGIAQLMA